MNLKNSGKSPIWDLIQRIFFKLFFFGGNNKGIYLSKGSNLL
jgi:arginine/ornithine N-succinyltransferase beta subunit